MPTLVLLTLLIALSPTAARAENRWVAGLGHSTGGVACYRLAVQHHLERRWLAGASGWLTGYLEGSAAWWQHNGEDDTIWALSPVAVYHFHGNGTIQPFIEAGIGGAYVAKKVIDSRDLSSHFQFEDRLGGGVDLHGHRLAATFFHYSNGGIKGPNDGINFWLLSYSRSF